MVALNLGIYSKDEMQIRSIIYDTEYDENYYKYLAVN